MKTRKPYHFILLFAVLAGVFQANRAAAQLEWRVSVKFILDGSGHRAASGDFHTDEQVYASFRRANARLETYGRGYRFRVVNIEDIHGHDEWFNEPISGEVSTLGDLWSQAAVVNQADYFWSDEAINIYVLGTRESGRAGDLILLGQDHEDKDDTPFHECCHFLGLLHTHGTPGRICTCGQADCNEEPILANAGPDDDVSDTLRDHNCWDSADEIAMANFGVGYEALRENPIRLRQVDETLNNLMGYHDVRDVLTEGQLDRLTDFSNNQRRNITNGRTRFVDVNSDCQLFCGSSSSPLQTVSAGVSAADPGDIVLIRKGHYSSALTISKRVFLRASRGSAVLGIR